MLQRFRGVRRGGHLPPLAAVDRVSVGRGSGGFRHPTGPPMTHPEARPAHDICHFMSETLASWGFGGFRQATRPHRGSVPRAGFGGRSGGLGRGATDTAPTVGSRSRAGTAAGPGGRPGRTGRRVRPRMTADSSVSRSDRVGSGDEAPSDHSIGRSARGGGVRLARLLLPSTSAPWQHGDRGH
jgi:hypothetical protein